MKTALRSVVMLPWWLIRVFSQAKSFTANPVLGNRLLNRLGLHAGRVLAAHAARRFRLLFIAPLVDRQLRQAYWRDGFVIIENFLPDDEFDQIDTNVRALGDQLEVRECIQGDTLTHRVLLDVAAREQLPDLNKLLENKRYLNLMAFVGATFKKPLFYIQRIANGFVEGRDDPQKSLHADTFHPTMKAWYFLDDVPLENGPFNYAPGSHRLTFGRLKWEYQRSVGVHDLKNIYSKRGSMRASAQDLKDMGYKPRQAVAVKRNTLVIADTHGFHCRGQAHQRARRLEIWAFCRTNPFSLFPGTGAAFVSKLENRGAKALWKLEDKKAAAKGGQSSWHIVDGNKMFGDS